MHSAKSGTSKRSASQSPLRKNKTSGSNENQKADKKSLAGSAVSKGKKSTTSAKSVTSIRSSLLSAKKSQPDDNKPKKVMIKSPDLAALNLRTEDLSFTGLTQVPLDIFTGKDIGELDLSGNNLRSIPSEVSQLTELRALNLSQNSLKCTGGNDYSGLPKELAELRHLEIVAISECNLRYIPAVLYECIHIKRLDISRNKFQMLPPDIGNLVDLEYLNASETSIKSLPPEIAFCERLQEINLYGNTLDMLPETMRELRALTELKLNARSFHSNIDDYMNKLIRNGQIKSEHIPSVLLDIPELKTLDLDGTRINNLPDENSCKLEDLYLSNNYFLNLPKGLKTLPYLVMVDLSHNFLTSIPENIPEYLPSVRILRLNHNLLTSLPASLCKLISLEELEICNNKLSQIPSAIGDLIQLKMLRVANNRVFSLPQSLSSLLDLETLELTNNRISELPLMLFNLTKMKNMHTFSHMKPIGLWLHKNPITEPPEVIWKGVQIKPLYQYLKKLQIRRTENMQTIKLILLGDHGCGKTTLSRTMATGKCQIRTDEFELSKEYLSPTERSGLMKRLPRDILIENIEAPNSTCVASIQNWQSENAIKFCSIDLGGSEVYKIIYQYLLSSNALYLLVYDHHRFEKEPESYYTQIGYWLDLLQLHTPGAVVKVAGTHADLATSSIEETKSKVSELIKKQLADHRGNLATELQRLKEKIVEAEQKAAKGEQTSSTNVVEFDPKANIMQMEYQKNQIESLLETPIKFQPEISVVSCDEEIPGVADLVSDLELLAINKELLPFGQRYIPSSWKKLKTALKKRQGFWLTFQQVKEAAEKYKLQGEGLRDCLMYTHDSGDIIWLCDHHKLSKYVFHKPLKLIEILRGILHHDIENILNFDENKSFSSVGKLSREQFEECKERLLNYGEISRQMLLGLWYYMSSNEDGLQKNYELISDFELAYLIPQSDIPTSQSYKEPLMVVPWYVKVESNEDEVSMYWSMELEEGQRQMEIAYDFTLQFPGGAFERLSAQLQGEAELRLDWANTIYIETGEAKILVKRYSKAKAASVATVSIQVRSGDLRVAMRYLAKLHQTWITILASIPGLVWRVAHYTARKHNQSDKAYTATPASSESRPISYADSK